MKWAALVVLAALALGGCETTQQKSAALEKQAKHFSVAHHTLTITRASTQVRVLDAAVMHGSEGAAAAVTVVNLTSHALRSVPIAITVKNSRGQILYRNSAAGLEGALTTIASLPAHGTVTWVDDQIPASGDPASVTAILGEAQSAATQPPIEISGLQLSEASTGEVSGALHNPSSTAQQQLVVYVTASRAGKVLAAGRAVLPELAPRSSAHFQAFLIGSPAGAKLQASAPASD